MAEIALKVVSNSQYDDGDILCAFNNRQILLANAELIFWPRINNDPSKPKVGGLLGDSYPLLQLVLEKIHQYKFQRISRNEAIRIDSLSSERIICSPYTNNKDWNMDVQAYINKRKNYGVKPLFGKDGKEIWYGGKCDYSLYTVEQIWDDIEHYTDNARDNYQLWPTGKLDLKHFFFMSTNDFDDIRANDIVVPSFNKHGKDLPAMEYSDNNISGEVLHKRKHMIQRQDLPGFSSHTEDQIQDRDIVVDIRKSVKFLLNNIIQKKGERK